MFVPSPSVSFRSFGRERHSHRTAISLNDPLFFEQNVYEHDSRPRCSDGARPQKRLVSPPVVELDDPAGIPLNPVEGNIVLLWAPAGSEAISTYDEVLETDNGEDVLPEYVSGHLDGGLEEKSSTATADLVYYGRELAKNLPLAGDEPFGVTMVPYGGGSLDLSAFEVHERPPDVAYEYRVIPVPLSLDEAATEAAKAVPEECDQPAGKILPPSASVAVAAVGVVFLASTVGVWALRTRPQTLSKHPLATSRARR